jgi:hypothetical protein
MGNHCAAAFNNQQINRRLQAADVKRCFFAGEVKGFHRAAVGGEEGTFQPRQGFKPCRGYGNYILCRIGINQHLSQVIAFVACDCFSFEGCDLR